MYLQSLSSESIGVNGPLRATRAEVDETLRVVPRAVPSASGVYEGTITNDPASVLHIYRNGVWQPIAGGSLIAAVNSDIDGAETAPIVDTDAAGVTLDLTDADPSFPEVRIADPTHVVIEAFNAGTDDSISFRFTNWSDLTINFNVFAEIVYMLRTEAVISSPTLHQIQSRVYIAGSTADIFTIGVVPRTVGEIIPVTFCHLVSNAGDLRFTYKVKDLNAVTSGGSGTEEYFSLEGLRMKLTLVPK